MTKLNLIRLTRTLTLRKEKNPYGTHNWVAYREGFKCTWGNLNIEEMLRRFRAYGVKKGRATRVLSLLEEDISKTRDFYKSQETGRILSLYQERHGRYCAPTAVYGRGRRTTPNPNVSETSSNSDWIYVDGLLYNPDTHEIIGE